MFTEPKKLKQLRTLCAAFGIGSQLLLASHSDARIRNVEISRSEVSIPNTRRIEFVSKVNGHRYSIDISLPFRKSPPGGYGVLYVLDGFYYFAGATEMTRLPGAANIVVVGIGYPDDPAYARRVIANRGPTPGFLAGLPAARVAPFLERSLDLTLPANDEELSAQSDIMSGLSCNNVGGLDDFLKIIETEVKPRVRTLVRIDPGKQALFGHSFGGLASLHALLVEPSAFQSFIIASPSIWWNGRAVLKDKASFAAVVSSGRAQPRVLVTMGGKESDPPNYPAEWGIDPASAKAGIEQARMVENGRELVEWLKSLHGSAQYQVADYKVFAGLMHSQSMWPALSLGIDFAFNDQ